MAAGAGDFGLGKRQFVALLPDHGQGLRRLGFFDLGGLRAADVQRPARFGGPAHAKGRDLDLGRARDFGHRRGTIHDPAAAPGRPAGPLLADGRGHHFFEGLLGLLLVVLGPMVVGRRRFVVAIPAWHRGHLPSRFDPPKGLVKR